MNLQLDEIAKAVGGSLEGPGAGIARGYSIDSRTLTAGDLFIAIRGPRFDGHDFVRQAMDKKAAGVMVERTRHEADTLAGRLPPAPNAGVIRVESTTVALQALAGYVRSRWAMPLIGVTGSVGKTTTKEMIAAVLAGKFTVLRSIGNLNNDLGLPLCLLRAERYQNIGVIEMGMSARGEIRRLAAIAAPNEGVITNVNPVHLEFFKSVDEIAEAKAELLEGLREPRVAYLNNDDSRVRAMARNFSGRIVTYGVKSVAAFKTSEVQDLGLDGVAFTVCHGRRQVHFVLPLLGRHNVANALAAIAVGVTHEVPWEKIQKAVAEMKPERMRGQVIRFREGFAAIDDTYNSNPKALTEMIRFMGKLEGQRHRIVVAGEMLELGPESAELHRACGREAARSGVDLVVGVQGMAREILDGAREAGMDAGRLKFVPDAVRAGELLAETVEKGDVILLKASRGVKLEQAVNTLRAAYSSLET